MSTTVHIRAPRTHSTPGQVMAIQKRSIYDLLTSKTLTTKINIIRVYHTENILQGLISWFGKLIFT